MQNERQKSTCNYYFLCRKEAAEYNDALNSRLSAAIQLNISESTLRDYEVDTTPIPRDVVCSMADLYHKPEMENHYCKYDCPIGKHIGRAMTAEVKGIESVTINLLNHYDEDKLHEIVKRLLQIASDGNVSDTERRALQKDVEYLENFSRDISDLRLIAQKEP